MARRAEAKSPPAALSGRRSLPPSPALPSLSLHLVSPPVPSGECRGATLATRRCASIWGREGAPAPCSCKSEDLGYIGYTRTRTRNCGYPNCRVVIFQSYNRVAFSVTRILYYPNYPTRKIRVTRMPSHSCRSQDASATPLATARYSASALERKTTDYRLDDQETRLPPRKTT